jgi:hypothetical protein
MPVTFNIDPDDAVIEVTASGKLTKDDYEIFLPPIEKFIEQHGKISVLFRMQDFHGWKVGALWEDTKFDLKHFRNIQRLALVGESKWQEMMSKFCEPFTTANIRFFRPEQLDEARQWVRGQ